MRRAEFNLVLPMPPSVNNLYMGQGKNMRKTPKCAAWFDEAGWRMNEARAKGDFSPLPSQAWYWTDIRLPENHLGDSDNRLKALHDLLHEMGATPDDRWLLGGTYMRCADVLPGTCQVAARSIPNGVSGHAQELAMIAEGLGFGTAEIEHRGQINAGEGPQ